MHQVERMSVQLNRVQLGAIGVAVLGIILSAVGAILDLNNFFQSYLIAFFYWVGISLGCLALFMVLNLIGGAMSFSMQRLLAAGARTLPLMALLFLPLIFGLNTLYSWTDPAVAATLPASKASFLTLDFFILRAALYFVIWILLVYFVTRFSYNHDRTGDDTMLVRAKQISIVGLLLVFVTTAFSSLDWVISLNPKWYSTIYGLLYISREGLGSIALGTLVLALLWQYLPLSARVRERTLNDVGSVMLAALMLWMYMEFFQFLIIWQGNLPDYTSWYVQRIQGGWDLFVIFVIVFHFGIPFAFLLTPGFRTDIRRLLAVASLILVMRLLGLFWVVLPVYSPSVSFNWMNLVLPLTFGGLWVALYIWNLKRHQLIPSSNPEWVEVERREFSEAEIIT
jgi:hypothetical protein